MLDYVNTRRTEKANESNNVPVLSALLGCESGRKARKTFRFDHVMCFQRMRGVGRSEQVSPATAIEKGQPRVGLADFLPQKRRKLRDGKAVALHTILDEL